MKFLLGSSFFCGGHRNVADLSEDWCLNLTRIDVQPAHVAIICEGGTKLKCTAGIGTVIELSGDLGNWSDIMHKRKPYEWSGWSASMMALAMLAYVNECDLVYRESDAFLFGECIKRGYADMGSGSIVFGKAHSGPPWMACSQSFFIVRHSWIPTFIKNYLAMGGETSEENLGEKKFVRLYDKFGSGVVKRLSFGVDRQRPIPWHEKTFYFQQPTPAEIQEAKNRGLL
jgi:hypothetical protein